MDDFTRRQRVAWGAGDYPDLAATIAEVSDVVVDAAGVGPGQDVLDVATGTGNAALVAAERGASVTGLDLTPRLLEVARQRAGAAGVEIAFQEGDAQSLPYGDDSFDAVTSVFGVMFAPDQQRAAAEMLRVCRAGATIVVSAWTSEGLNGQMFGVLGRHLPPPPSAVASPMLWGSEHHIGTLFPGADVGCERRTADRSATAESVEAWVSYLERVLGPLALAKQALEPAGLWDAARAELVELYERHNEAQDGSFVAKPEYLLSVIRKSA